MSQRLAVTRLADFVHRRGDLHTRLDGRTRADEGVAAQRQLQRNMSSGYQRERRVELCVVLAAETFVVGGRIDGCDVESRLIEEYKTTRSEHADAHAHHQSSHWAQIQLYGGLLCRELDASGSAPHGSDRHGSDPNGSARHGSDRGAEDARWRLRLVYVHPDTLATTHFERDWSSRQLTDFLAETLDWYADWLRAQRAHVAHRDQAIGRLRFPFGEYRRHQRALATRAYRALRDGEALLLEAPTGSGKTMGLLYPALKSLTLAQHKRFFYLTSRTTGGHAVLQACAQLDPDGAYLRVLQITAKAQACSIAGVICDGSQCEYSVGYFDRVHDAVRALLALCAMTPSAIATVAQAHRVCPFELSLDAARWADVIIGDYNYIFDPMVRLRRFVDDSDMALLIDESHQLSGRVQEMLALELDRACVRAALLEPVSVDLVRCLSAIDRQLRELHSNATAGDARVIDEPGGLLRAIRRLTETLATSDVDLAALPNTQAVFFECTRWVRSAVWYEPATCIYVAQTQRRSRGGRKDVSVRLVPLDPGAYLAKVLAGYGAHIRFSGTVSPLPLYQRLHGLQGALSERAGSPFAPNQLAVCIVDDIPTLYRRRQSGLTKLVELIAAVAAAQPGNYLVALPSFEYLQACAERMQAKHPQVNVCAQTPMMNLETRSEFLAQLEQTERCVVGFVVLGGVFAESVNIANEQGSTLAGVVCVGVGIPPPSIERDAMVDYFNAEGADGPAVAYRQPAMNKVLQVAGRLLRDPADRGVLILVDARFKEPAYQRFFPSHWHAQSKRSAQVAAALEIFWRPGAASPRLPGPVPEPSASVNR